MKAPDKIYLSEDEHFGDIGGSWHLWGKSTDIEYRRVDEERQDSIALDLIKIYEESANLKRALYDIKSKYTIIRNK